jgi:hypothetical protein
MKQLEKNNTITQDEQQGNMKRVARQLEKSNEVVLEKIAMQ